jgi:hypothetical protein
MAQFALIDNNNSILRIDFAQSKPADPSGKGWRYVDIQIMDDPVFDDTCQILGSYQLTYNALTDKVEKSRSIEEITGISNVHVNNERERRIAAGKTVTVGGTPDKIFPVDTDAISIRNIQGLGSAATLRIIQGDTTTLTSFRDSNNIGHDLTPLEIVALAMGVAAHIKDVYNASWAIKDDINGLPANLRLLKADPRWP